MNHYSLFIFHPHDTREWQHFLYVGTYTHKCHSRCSVPEPLLEAELHLLSYPAL